MSNHRYTSALEEIRARLQIRGDNPFRIRAFDRAARSLRRLAEPVERHLDAGTIRDIDGVGEAIAEELGEIRQRGSGPLLDELRAEQPAGLVDVLKISGIGPSKVRALWSELGVEDLDSLEEAVDSGKLESLKGFGPKLRGSIPGEIERVRYFKVNIPIALAWPQAVSALELLRQIPEVSRAEFSGDIVEGVETLATLELVAASESAADVIEAFTSAAALKRIDSQTDTQLSGVLGGGLPARLTVAPPSGFGAAVFEQSSSEDHKAAVRDHAAEAGLTLTPAGLYKGAAATPGSLEPTLDEAELFRKLDLDWITPELRRGADEVELAKRRELPPLLSRDDLRADLHMHTTWSDGQASVAEMAREAAQIGHEYICITDHSGSLKVANGLDAARLAAQLDEIDEYNLANPDGVRVLKGLEVDIMEDGSVDMEDELLARLDWVVGSVHQWMNQGLDTMTSRVVRAVRSGWLSAVGHPTTRVIGRRGGIELDLEPVLDACEEFGVALELNSSPWRLDLNAENLERVLSRPSLWLTLNTDAHSLRELGQQHFGLKVARRAQTPASRVLNTLPLERFLETRRKPARSS